MNEKEIKEDIDYILNNVPYLYQYISISGALKFIDNLQLMVSKPQRFNDPYDCIYDLIQFKHIPKKYLQNGHKEDYVRELFSKKIFPDTLKNMGVSCFSETGDNMLMWSHYADCHQGICVAYNLNEFYSTLDFINKTQTGLLKVNYTEEFKPKDFFSDYKAALWNWLGTKSNCWSYEKEVRIIFPNFPFKEDEECQLIDINKRSIKKIFLGSRISLENEKKVISTLLKTELPIEFYKMERKKNSFQLLPSKIDVKSSVANKELS